MKYLLLFLFVFTTYINAEDIEEVKSQKDSLFQIIQTQEKSIKRDFYINEYLKLDDISSQEAYEVLPLINTMNTRLFHNFAKKFNNDETTAVSQCMQASIKDLIYSNADCLAIGLDIQKASTLSTYELKLVLQNLQEKYPKLKEKIKVLSSAIPFTKLIVKDKDTFYDIFLNVDKNFREKYFNYKLPTRTLERIKSDNQLFNKFIQIVLLDFNLTNLEIHIKDLTLSQLNEKNKFLLSLYYIRKNNFNKAYKILENISTDFNFLYKEKIEFFKYLITKDISILNNITTMTKLNIYSFYANEVLENNFELPKLKHLEFIDKLKGLSTSKTALLYASINTKSNFNDTMVSKQFDLGITQLKIDFIKQIQKEYDINEPLIKQFDLENNIEYFLNLLNNKGIINNYLNLYNENFKINTSYKNLDNFIKLEYLSFYIQDLNKFLTNYYLYYNKKEKIKIITILKML